MSGSGRARYQIERPTIAARISVTMAAAAVALPVGRSRCRSALTRSSGDAGLSFTSVMRCSSPPRWLTGADRRSAPRPRHHKERMARRYLERLAAPRKSRGWAPGGRLGKRELRETKGAPRVGGRRIWRFSYAFRPLPRSARGGVRLAAADTPLTIGQLLAQGWRSPVMQALRQPHLADAVPPPGVNVLVQCGVLYDVTRNPRTIVNCYELK